MTRFEKHDISRKITGSLSKICNYKDAITRMTTNKKLFVEANLEIKLVGTRNTVWESLSIEDAVSILKRKIKAEGILLAQYEKRIK